jgi:CheY-like chemotaxis protein
MPTVLIIDDDEMVRESESMLLESGGWTTLEAQSGYAGLDKARQSLPDLIICDISMPQMDGLMTLKEIRRDLRLRLTPVLMVTGRPDSSVDRAMEMGAQGALTKPFRRGDLLREAERALGQNNPNPPPCSGRRGAGQR